MVNVQTKDVGDVKNIYNNYADCKCTLEDRNEDYIKRQLGVQDE